MCPLTLRLLSGPVADGQQQAGRSISRVQRLMPGVYVQRQACEYSASEQ
jgi:hypothetical protein